MVGGTWTVTVRTAGNLDPKVGHLIGDDDTPIRLGEIAFEFSRRPIIAMLPTPITTASFATYIADRLRPLVPGLTAVVVTLDHTSTEVTL